LVLNLNLGLGFKVWSLVLGLGYPSLDYINVYSNISLINL